MKVVRMLTVSWVETGHSHEIAAISKQSYNTVNPWWTKSCPALHFFHSINFIFTTGKKRWSQFPFHADFNVIMLCSHYVMKNPILNVVLDKLTCFRNMFYKLYINNGFVLTFWEHYYRYLWTNILLLLQEECLFISFRKHCQNVSQSSKNVPCLLGNCLFAW